jgi:hypothetical protein
MNVRRATAAFRCLPLVITLLVLLISSLQSLEAQTGPCDTGSDPHKVPYNPLVRLEGENGRPQVEGDYVVIEYNALTYKTSWYDYRNHDLAPQPIDINGSFLPVVYNREKIAVHVCDLKFADQLTVTTNPLALPEGGADVHGYIPTAPTALSPSLDALQSVSSTGVASPASGLGYSTTPGLTVGSVPGLTAQTTSKDSAGKITGTTDATISLDPGQIALQMYALVRNGEALVESINEMPHGQKSTPASPTAILSGSIDYVLAHAMVVNGEIKADFTSPEELAIKGHDYSYRANQAAFDRDLSDVQVLATELSTLAATLAANGYGTRAATLQNNYSILRGVLNTTGYGQGHNNNAAFQTFNESYDAKLSILAIADGKNADEIKNWVPKTMFDALDNLRTSVQKIDAAAGSAFAEINRWNEDSRVEQTDLITPVANNALMRISILVQHSYTPFTLTNNPAATAAVPASVATGTSATTSTPPHAVKTILVEVHRLANFNLAGGVVFFDIANTTYTVTPSTNGTGTTTTTGTTMTTTYTGTCNGTTGPTASQGTAGSYSCVVPTQTSNIQIAGMAGLTFYPWRRDYFPRRSGYSVYKRNLYPSILAATSVTSLGNSMIAGNWEPINGLDFFAGIGWAHSNVLPNGITQSTILPAGFTLQLGTQVKTGLAFGVAFDFGLLNQLFGGKTSSASLP